MCIVGASADFLPVSGHHAITQQRFELAVTSIGSAAALLGTAARHQVGVETPVPLPREGCRAYRDTGHRLAICRKTDSGKHHAHRRSAG
jgi:hypothetical protein